MTHDTDFDPATLDPNDGPPEASCGYTDALQAAFEDQQFLAWLDEQEAALGLLAEAA
jgi:hypothetical protein